MVHGALPLDEIQHSSTRRELVGLLHLARTPSILRSITGKRVKILMDSIPALRNLINGGGPVENLTAAVKEWTQLCEQYRIQPTYDWIPRAANWRADKASKLHHQQHTFRSAEVEERIRTELTKLAGTHTRRQTNHWLGRVPIFTPMFHQVDSRVEMIRTQLEEAIIVVPEWPAGGTHDWFRRVEQNSIARLEVGKAREVYAEGTGTGHSETLIGFWLLGRRAQKRGISFEDSLALVHVCACVRPIFSGDAPAAARNCRRKHQCRHNRSQAPLDPRAEHSRSHSSEHRGNQNREDEKHDHGVGCHVGKSAERRKAPRCREGTEDARMGETQR